MNARKLADMIRNVFITHDEYPRKASKRYRGQFKDPSQRAPFGIHPAWPAMTILHEANLPKDLRWQGATTLLHHDLIEDTTSPLPEGLSKKIRQFVAAMTFNSFDEEAKHIWEKSPEVRLFSMYDKVSTLLSNKWMFPERQAIHRIHVLRLATDVEENFGKLDIVYIARALCEREL